MAPNRSRHQIEEKRTDDDGDKVSFYGNSEQTLFLGLTLALSSSQREMETLVLSINQQEMYGDSCIECQQLQNKLMTDGDAIPPQCPVALFPPVYPHVAIDLPLSGIPPQHQTQLNAQPKASLPVQVLDATNQVRLASGLHLHWPRLLLLRCHDYHFMTDLASVAVRLFSCLIGG